MSKPHKKSKVEARTEEQENTNAIENEGNAEAGASTEAAAEPKAPRGIILTLEDGSTCSRAEYIRKRWVDDKAGRGVIAKELTKLQGKEVPYQIVFQATSALAKKGITGGPDPKVEGEVVEKAAE